MNSRYRLLFGSIALAVVAALLVSVGASWLVRSAVREPFLERIRAETSLLAEGVSRLDTLSLQAYAVRVAGNLNVRVTLISEDGTVLADSARPANTVGDLENHRDRPEIRSASAAGVGESFRLSDTTSVRYFYSARRVPGDGPVRFVRIALPAARISNVQAGYTWPLGVFVLASLLVMAGVAYGFVRALSKPLESITAAVERVAHDDLTAEIPDAGGQEVARLADSVRRMRAALLEQLRQLGTERSLFSSVIAGMRQGLVVIGPDLRIQLANIEARRILELSFDPTGHLLAEAVREPQMLEDVERALEERREVRESIVRLFGGRAFELHVTPLGPSDQGRVLALLFDITRLEALEGVRRQFVANVSHELRTPLTAIRACVENLLDGKVDDAEGTKRFLDIVHKHTERMSALVEDLTDLSLIETGSIRLDIRPTRVREVVQEVIEQVRPLAARTGVELEVDVPPGLQILADRRRVEQTLTNLIDNAIKFNRRGGYVRVDARDGERPVIRVEDSGIGIARDNAERVFHRFFQVDQARSRQSGGTGLGLAIVKHLMRLQGGRVTLESELGVGSTFILEFPGLADRAAETAQA